MDGSELNGGSPPHDEEQFRADPVYGRKVNRAARQDGTSVPGSKCLPCRLEDSCVVSGDCRDPGRSNGFRTAGGRTDGWGHAGPCSVGLGEEMLSAPGPVSGTGSGLRGGCGGTECGESPDSEGVIPGHRKGDGQPVKAEVSVSGEPQKNGRPGGGRRADTTHGQTAEGVARRGAGEEVNVANGGLHLVCTPRDVHEPQHSENNTTLPDEPEPPPQGTGVRTSGAGQGHEPGGLPPAQDLTVPGQGPPLHVLLPETPSDATNPPSTSPPSPDLPSANPASARPPSTVPSPPSPDPSLAARPQTLRTRGSTAVSLSCDATPLSPEEGAGLYLEGAGRRQSAPDPFPDPPESGPPSPTKRTTIAEFFTRSLFSRKSKEPVVPTQNAPGWRLFGKAAPESDGGQQRPLPPGRRKPLEFEPQSTTALILEQRPGNLPAKSEEEAQRHQQEYQEMVAGARRREVKEAQRRKRKLKERHRREESISHAINTWTAHILPRWDQMKCTRRVRELWWHGLPPSVRGRVWSLAIGNDLNITPELYDIFLCRVKDRWRCSSETSSVNDSESDGGASLADRESSLDLIKLDISRTFPSLFIFQKGGPYHEVLHSLLGAYTCYRPDIGYVQGMSFMAAVLLLNLEEGQAFITFTNLLNKPCQVTFFRVDHQLMLKYFAAFEVFFEENLPRLFRHFLANSLTPDLYLIDWIFTLYSKALPLDVACRVWDVFCRDGEESLFRTALGLLRLYQDVLLQMDFIHMAQFLTRLPPDLPPHLLFSSMASTPMVCSAGRWAQVFSSLMKDGYKEPEKNGSPALRS
ncbi:TBC1 domain family member 12 isoform X1 [Gadus morhua]|uniref:TBC1 domain family member 12 isoform X1 n=1 Tax=Gadus morhua TaxID=8049 RepID=UPI0011B84171|nr:TBC1 domain family member 12-like isoform X1 [Gadus morhua]